VALLTISEAAIKSGFSAELLESLATRCPKPREHRVLQTSQIGGDVYIDDGELDDYLIYLRSPWPVSKGAGRPRVPDAIARDVREECHHACAICGDMNNGEVAHIDPVADTLNNSPDNLLLLCPNHHTEYDYGYKVSSNLTREIVLATKTTKRASRRRMLQYEGNVAGMLRSIVQRIRKLDSDARAEEDDGLRTTYVTELEALLRAVPELAHAAQEAAAKDEHFATEEAALVKVAPKLFAATQGIATASTNPQTAAASVISASADLIDLDEVDCPHCGGAGTTGLIGNYCAFCGGSQVVSTSKADGYDRKAIDEVECPHCGGDGTTGMAGNICAFCGGSQVVSTTKADGYDRKAIDEVECPHCGGDGTTGLAGNYCAFCKGSQVVSASKADGYDPVEIDEVGCPRCGGSGTKGFVGDVCKLCRGKTVVTTVVADAYTEKYG